MAQVTFKKGLLANLPATKTEGAFYVTTDERAIYLDISASERIRIGDFQEFASVNLLNANPNPSTTALYYVSDINCLAKWDGSRYVQINLDTGATDIEVAGEGNAVTGAAYDPTSRKITLTKGATYTTAGDVHTMIDGLKLADTYDAKGAAAQALTDAKSYADSKAVEEAGKKVDSVIAADDSVTIGGAATVPTVSVALDNTAGNQLTLVEGKGLRVEVPAGDVYSIAKLETPTEGMSASYQMTKNGSNVGAVIDIPKDMVVSSGRVVTNPEGQEAGTYIELTLANATNDKLYIDVANLIEYVTSGSVDSDSVVVAVSADHKVTATITDGTITLAKLHTDVRTEINKAHTHSNATVLDGITSDKVAAWDAAEDHAKSYADTKKSEVLGNADTDTSDSKTIEGTRKYADTVVSNALIWGTF